MISKSYSYKIWVNIVIPIFLGIIIYGLLRGIHFVDPTEMYFPICTFKFPNWIKYNLPDGLWFYALLSALFLIWRKAPVSYFLFWFVLVTVLTVFTEVFQYMNIIPGTFDRNDLLTYFITIIIFALNFKYEIIIN